MIIRIYVFESCCNYGSREQRGGLLNLAPVHERCVRYRTRRGSAGAAAPLAITPLQQFTLLEHSHMPMTEQLQTQGWGLIGTIIKDSFSCAGAAEMFCDEGSVGRLTATAGWIALKWSEDTCGPAEVKSIRLWWSWIFPSCSSLIWSYNRIRVVATVNRLCTLFLVIKLAFFSFPRLYSNSVRLL